MRILKRIIFPLFSIFLIYQSVGLLTLLSDGKLGELNAVQSISIAFIISLFITGIFAFLGFAYPTGRLLPKAYYKIKNPKRLKFVYETLGLKYFRFFLLFTFWGKEKNRKKYFNGTKKGLDNFVFQTKQSEFGHLAALVAVVIVNIFLLYKGYDVLAISLFAINVVGNLYPIVLQRFHRIRIERILGV